MITAPRDHFVYWLLDAEGNSLYIGCTRCPERRWRTHRYQNPQLAALAARRKMRGPYTRAVARAIEKAAIRAEDPLFNFEAPGLAKIAKRTRINALFSEATGA